MIGVRCWARPAASAATRSRCCALHPERFRVSVLAARSNGERCSSTCARFEPEWAALESPEAARALEQQLRAAGSRTRVAGRRGGDRAARSRCQVDYVMAAISGAAGLRSTLAAAAAGKRLLLANKESAVMAGALLMAAVRASGARADPDRQRAQRDLPVPAARIPCRRAARGGAAAAADRLGRAVPELERRGAGQRRRRRRPAPTRAGAWAARSRWIRRP